MSRAISRRDFVKTVAAGAVAASAIGLPGCGDSDDGGGVTFPHGVASGDPLADRVILWTRAVPDRGDAVELRWEIATDAAFTAVVGSGTVTASSDRDFTAKVDATGLSAGTVHHYRFSARGAVSPAGRTKTLPTGAAAQVKLALFSCSNFPAGFFNAYDDAANVADLDLALHVGDYIYEYERGGYASENAAALGRLSEPPGELLTLADYRRRYQQYRSDPDLQRLHAHVPFVVTWDDHEIANDAWTGGAQNHGGAAEGTWAARRAAAIQAWQEWLPVRLPDPARPDLVWRSFDLGDLASLHVLDTRHFGRDRQVDVNAFVTPAGFDAAGFAAAIGDPARQLLGAEQLAWLQGRLAASSATWQLLGQQVLMGRMNVPAPIALRQISVSAYAALLVKQATDPGSLTPEEQAILAAPSIPYNLDAWDGYAAQREAVLGAARAAGRNLVVLSGDTHNAWANHLDDLAGNPVGVEIGGHSVSSPGFEAIFTAEDPDAFAAGVTQLIGPLQWADTSRRGWVLVTVTPGEVRADWRAVSTISSRTHTASTIRSLRTLPGAGNRRFVEV